MLTHGLMRLLSEPITQSIILEHLAQTSSSFLD